jgi:hypothetical protein
MPGQPVVSWQRQPYTTGIFKHPCPSARRGSSPSRRYILALGLLNVPSYKAPAICITPAWDRPIRALDSKWQITPGTPAHSPTNRSALILNEDYFSPAGPNSSEDFWHIKLILSPLAHLL